MNISKKSRSYDSLIVGSVLALTISLTGALVASAQTTSDVTMPPLYNSAGAEVNDANVAPLTAGYYYLAPGAQANTQVYYYGDGTFVNETTGLYGGSVSDPNGTADVTLIYGTKTPGVVPGAPNTGAGGDAAVTWMTLLVTGVLASVGTAYLITRKHPALT